MKTLTGTLRKLLRARWPRLRRALVVTCCVLAVTGLLGAVAVWQALVWMPFDKEALQPVQISTTLFDRNGKPLRGYLSTDQRWRVPVRLTEVSPWVTSATLAVEDHRFYDHGGVDLRAVVRAAISNIKGGRVISGASTITMQVAGFTQPRERTFSRKLRQVFRALQIERHLTKQEILELYLTNAPYGGNICGIEAAARRYFNKSGAELNLQEATLVAGIPQSPSRLRPDRFPENTLKRRAHVLSRMKDCRMISPKDYDRAIAQKPAVGNYNALMEAPQFCELVHSRYGGMSRLQTTLDLPIQHKAERLLGEQVNRLKPQGVSNGSVVVVDNHTGDVLAMVGSADYDDLASEGRINGAVALRSPGSTLKPLIFAYAYQNRVLLPTSVLYDIPRQFPEYEPQNFDRTFHGLVSAEQALALSLNIPAIQVLHETGLYRTLRFIRNCGVQTLEQPANEYGLSVAIGTCSVQLLELTNAYAMLARGGLYKPYRLLREDESAVQSAGTTSESRLLSQAASWMVTRTLADENLRPPENLDPLLENLRNVAWKTGTSSNFKDAWTISYDQNYTVGVWIGNFNGHGSAALVGSTAAAPVALKLIRELKGAGRDNEPPWPVVPTEEMRQISVCSVTGYPAGSDCPTTSTADATRSVAAGAAANVMVDSAPVCTVHRRARLDTERHEQLCLRCWNGRPSEEKVFCFWPAPVAAWLADSQLLKSAPPPHYHQCNTLANRPAVRITAPREGDAYIVTSGRSPEMQKVSLEAAVSPHSRKLFWFLNGELIETVDRNKVAYLVPKPGKHDLRCIDDSGLADAITFTVKQE